MLLSLFSYTREIPLTIPNYSGHLENVEMFDDTLVLHKDIDNPFHIKVTDRDRVRLKITDESIPVIKFRIIDEKRVVVSSFYLQPVDEGDFWTYTISKDEVNELNADEDYRFTATLEIDDGMGGLTEHPLYIDHNFAFRGNIEVHDAFYDIITESYTSTDPIIKTSYDKETVLENANYFRKIVLMEHSLKEVTVTSNDNMTQCHVSVQKHLQRHHPIEHREEQWETTARYYNIGTDNVSVGIVGVPEGAYFRVVIHTDNPDNFTMNVSHIQK